MACSTDVFRMPGSDYSSVHLREVSRISKSYNVNIFFDVTRDGCYIMSDYCGSKSIPYYI